MPSFPKGPKGRPKQQFGQRVCLYCKVEFTPNSYQRQYCTEVCSKRAESDRKYSHSRPPARMITNSCARCDKPYARRSSGARTKFCSPACWYGSRRDKKTTWKKCEECRTDFNRKFAAGRRLCSPTCQAKNRGTLLACDHCKKEFRGKARRKYCSRKCAMRGVHLTENTPKPCLNCKQPFTRNHPYFTARAKFCNKACQSAHSRGANHPLYRGNRRQDRGADWKQQSELARGRDGNLCQSCKRTKEEIGQHLSVDHFVPYRLAKAWAAGCGASPNDLRNLFSLCRSCHGKKTQLEAKLLRGDIMGFIQSVSKLGLEEPKMNEALRLFRLPEISNGRVGEHGQF